MKNKLVLTLLTIALATSVVKAQEAAAGAAVGAVAGAAIGANNHNPVAGAVTGALVGGLIGNAIEANKQPQPQVVVVQTPPPPPAPVVVQAPTPPPPPPIVMAPVVVQSPVNYVWGPLNHHGYPEYVYVQVWNGHEWVTTYYAYNQFLVWYGRYYGRPFREVEFRHHWHR
jgi:Glycine zipper